MANKYFFTKINDLWIATHVEPKSIEVDEDNPELWDVRGNTIYEVEGHRFSSIVYGEGRTKKEAVKNLYHVWTPSIFEKIKAFFRKAC